MQTSNGTRFLRIAAVSAILISTGLPAFVSARAQANPSTAPAPPAVPLQTYTLPDKSASAGVPAGWKVTGGGSGMISMSGSKGETITLGQIIVAHDGPFQAGQKGPDGAALTMPGSAKLSDKIVMIFQQTAATSGKPAPQIKFIYGAPLQVPAAMGQCGVFVVSNGSGNTSLGDAMGILCSLPDDSGQFFKNILMIGSAPAAVAANTAPTFLAVLKSYTTAPGWTQKMLSPFMSPAMGAQGPGPSTQDVVDSFTNVMSLNQQVIDHGATCTDANIIGPSNLRTAVECGYLPPNF